MRPARLWIALACLLAVVAGGLGAGSGRGGERTGPGLRAYVDPDTGRLGPGPAGRGAVVPPARTHTATTGLIETPGATPAGGVTVRLGGRFRTTMRARLGPDGRAVTRCEQ